MKKDLGVNPFLFPMPVLMVGSYNEDGTVNVMNMAWGGICAANQVCINIAAAHKTAENVRRSSAFTLALPDVDHLAQADYFGIASGNTVADKFVRSGLHAVKSSKVDAPVVEEFPLTLECKVLEIRDSKDSIQVIGEIMGVLAEESVLDGKGMVDPKKLNTFFFDVFHHDYYAMGDKVGQAWHSGAALGK